MLDEHDIPAALYSGTVAEMGMMQLRGRLANLSYAPFLTFPMMACFNGDPFSSGNLDSHTPNDVDLMVHNDYFDAAVDVLGVDVGRKHKTIDTMDGYHLDYNVLVAYKDVGGKLIEIYHPDGPMHIEKEGVRSEYNWHVSDLASEHFEKYKTRQGIVSIAHRAETAIIYGILRRSDRDIRKAAFAMGPKFYDRMDNQYVTDRLAEMNMAEERIGEFICKVLVESVEVTLRRDPSLTIFGMKRCLNAIVKRHEKRTDQLKRRPGDKLMVLDMKIDGRSATLMGAEFVEYDGETYEPNGVREF